MCVVHTPSGRDELHEDPTSHKTYHSVQVAGLNPGLMHLKPNKACLEFVEAMLQVRLQSHVCHREIGVHITHLLPDDLGTGSALLHLLHPHVYQRFHRDTSSSACASGNPFGVNLC